MAYDAAKRGQAGGGNGGGKVYGRGGGGSRPAPAAAVKAPEKDTTPTWSFTQYNPDAPEGQRNPFCGAAWPTTKKDGTVLEDLWDCTIRMDEVAVTQDKEGRDVLRIQLKPFQGKKA